MMPFLPPLARSLAAALLFAALLPAPGAQAQPQTSPSPAAPKALPKVSYVVKGKDFHVLSRPQRDDPSRTDVIVFFWYGSPWSAQVEPYLREWVDSGRAPANLRLTFVPVVLDRSWRPGAYVYYALEKMGLQRRLTPLLLRDVHRKRLDLASPKSLARWLDEQGVDPRAFQDALLDPMVAARVSGLGPLARMYEVRSTPTFIIDGRYQVRAHEQMPPERAAAVAMFMADRLGRQ